MQRSHTWKQDEHDEQTTTVEPGGRAGPPAVLRSLLCSRRPVSVGPMTTPRATGARLGRALREVGRDRPADLQGEAGLGAGSRDARRADRPRASARSSRSARRIADGRGRASPRPTRRQAELVAENEQLKAASVGADRDRGSARERRIQELLVRLPEPIRERVKPLSQRIPDEPGGDQAAAWRALPEHRRHPQRGQQVQPGDHLYQRGPRRCRTARRRRSPSLYVGIGQALLRDRRRPRRPASGPPRPRAGRGRPANEAAAEIAQAIAILKNEESAEFVRLPIRIESRGVNE